MRIGVVSYRFPPYNAIGAVSVGQTVKYLDRMGHDVRVLTAADQPLEPSLGMDIDPAKVVATKWFNVSTLAEAAVGGRAAVARQGFSASGVKGAVLRPLRRAYRGTVHFPDAQIGWYPYAVPAGRRLFRSWTPHVLFASAGPYTSLLVAARLGRELGIPWVGGFRDLWVDNAYREIPRLRRVVEEQLERRVVRSAAGLVAVSEPLADILRAKYETPVAVVSNGFDEEAMAALPARTPGLLGTGPLVITYTGTIIEGRRDPTPLFRAIRRLGLGRSDIIVRFVGRYLDVVDAMRHREGVADLVEVLPPVSHAEALAQQRNSDVLLLLFWDDPREYGVVPGKIFEYLGSRRPILSLGYVDGVPSRLIRERGAGVTANDEGEIAEALRRWVDQKREGGIPDLPLDRLGDLTRRAQTERLAAFLEGLASTASPGAGSTRLAGGGGL